jgi:serine/threonine-protein kinase
VPLAPGSRIGVYEVSGLLGAGGMGEVYRARDTRLNRDVALKVLPDLFAADPERLARFEREAQLLASLNHPHIAQIYGIEGRALVMELVEGDTLADRIAGGALPVEEAMAIARQIAEALAAAHDQGIVHRDLKPANVNVTPDGRVKVLDFGLAKLNDAAAPPGPGASASPSSCRPVAMPARVTANRINGQPRAFDILPDGTFVGPVEGTSPEGAPQNDPSEIRVVLGWTAELSRLVPVN